MVDLVARDDELMAGIGRLRAEGRLVVVGTGGIGKTSLARELANRVAAETVLVVAEGIARPDAVLSLAADGVAPGGTSAGDAGVADDPADELAARTRGRSVALLLDGVDEIVDEVLERASVLPTTGDGPWAIVTSRVRPTRPGWPVLVLGPVSGGGRRSPAADLFAARYASAGGDPALLTHAEEWITRTLADAAGVPLAIEVAAARGAVTGFDGPGDLSAEIVADVVGRSVRRSLAALPDATVELFTALGVTSGTVPVSLAGHLAGRSHRPVMGDLELLVRHSLLQPVPGGFAMLPPIHACARELAAATHDPTANERHRAWCLGRASSARTSDEAEVILAAAHDLRLAAERAADDGDVDECMQIVLALDDALRLTMQHRRREELLTAILHTIEADDHPLQRAELLRRLALVTADTTGMASARSCLDDAAGILGDLDASHSLRIDVERIRAAVRAESGDPDGAVDALLDAARRSSEQGDVDGALHARRFAANALLDLGRLDEAERQADRVVDAAGPSRPGLRQLGMDSQAMIALERGDHARCAALARILAGDPSSEERRRDGEYLQLVADPRVVAHHAAWHDQPPTRPGATSFQVVTELGRAVRCLVLDDPESALRVATDAAVAAEGRGLMWGTLDGLLLAGDAAVMLEDRPQAAACYRHVLELAQRHHYVLRLADALDGLARVRTGLVADDANAAAAHLRHVHGAAARPQPWLPRPPTIRTRPRWSVNGRLTSAGLERFMGRDDGRDEEAGAGPVATLTPAERRVSALVADGCTNREIAERLFVGRRTVETHLQHAYQKLGISNRTQLAMLVSSHIA